MRLVSKDEYTEITALVKKEMRELAMHEKKNSYMAQSAINNCYVRHLPDNSLLFQIFSPGFIHVVEQDYINALKETPECFGTGNARDVIHGLFVQARLHNWPWDENRYLEYLSNEIFCLLICKRETSFCREMLRVDLFRQLKESKTTTDCYEFIGGIFHALKHFSIKEQCASLLPNQNVDLYDVEQLIWPIANAFFMGTWKKGNRPKTFETSTLYLGKRFTLELYREDNSNVAFVNTLIPIST